MPIEKPGRKVGGLASIVGIAAAAWLYVEVPKSEGTVYKTYRDPVGIMTYCTGGTEDAIWGKVYTPDECRAQLDRDLARAAIGVMKCMKVELTDGQKAAFTDTAYNIGVAAFCRSTAAKLANALDVRGSCEAIMKFIYAGGKIYKGLVTRRERAVKVCLEGPDAAP